MKNLIPKFLVQTPGSLSLASPLSSASYPWEGRAFQFGCMGEPRMAKETERMLPSPGSVRRVECGEMSMGYQNGALGPKGGYKYP
jgi:hypothetical protein